MPTALIVGSNAGDMDEVQNTMIASGMFKPGNFPREYFQPENYNLLEKYPMPTSRADIAVIVCRPGQPLEGEPITVMETAHYLDLAGWRVIVVGDNKDAQIAAADMQVEHAPTPAAIVDMLADPTAKPSRPAQPPQEPEPEPPAKTWGIQLNTAKHGALYFREADGIGLEGGSIAILSNGDPIYAAAAGCWNTACRYSLSDE